MFGRARKNVLCHYKLLLSSQGGVSVFPRFIVVVFLSAIIVDSIIVVDFVVIERLSSLSDDANVNFQHHINSRIRSRVGLGFARPRAKPSKGRPSIHTRASMRYFTYFSHAAAESAFVRF